MTGGSDRLRALYLDETRSAVAWLLDPDNRDTMAMLRAAAVRTPADVCDPGALADDLDDLGALVLERHIGFATGTLSADRLREPLLAAIEGWRARLRDERPGRWGAAIGTDGLRLRELLGDAHARLAGEDPRLVAAVDPRRDDPVRTDPGPIVATHVHDDDVLYVRIRRFAGDPAELAALCAWSEDHDRHFDHARIVVDLRGNGGGDDAYVYDWIATHARHAQAIDTAAWVVDDRILGTWAAWVWYRARFGADSDAARRFGDRSFHPSPGSALALTRETTTVAAGADPWPGRMLVVIDAGVASSGESAAVRLRDGLGARIVGSPSRGCQRFGNLAFYPLARSGLVLRLGTTLPGLRVPEFTGIPVDAPLGDPAMSPTSIAADFDRLWDAGGG